MTGSLDRPAWSVVVGAPLFIGGQDMFGAVGSPITQDLLREFDLTEQSSLFIGLQSGEDGLRRASSLSEPQRHIVFDVRGETVRFDEMVAIGSGLEFPPSP